VHDRADAADLTQEVFVKVFRGVSSFHGESSLRTWIYRIALREASNQRRWWMRHKQQETPIEQEMTRRRLRNAAAAERYADRSGGVALRPGRA
jgi:RNA polymerase sigma-70 factor (ECF subfamily)